jgi:N-acyl-D-aspartate/D-glutamate deacylase
MQYDLIIGDETVADGSGMPGFRADVGIAGGRIATIGKIRQSVAGHVRLGLKATQGARRIRKA